jgi:hypothetical protein
MPDDDIVKIRSVTGFVSFIIFRKEQYGHLFGCGGGRIITALK